MRIHFSVVCEKCGQHLASADGEHYAHENAADCDGGEVTLPKVSVEQLTELLSGDVVAQKVAALNEALDNLLKAQTAHTDAVAEEKAVPKKSAAKKSTKKAKGN